MVYHHLKYFIKSHGIRETLTYKKDKVIGETSIEVQRMADVARSTGNHSAIIKGVIQNSWNIIYTVINALIISFSNNPL